MSGRTHALPEDYRWLLVTGAVLGIAVSVGYFGLGAAHVMLRRRSN